MEVRVKQQDSAQRRKDRNMHKEFTIWGEDLEELEMAVDRVDAYMDKKTGDNIIRYQIMGKSQCMPWDSGCITDEALEDLQQGFIISQD